MELMLIGFMCVRLNTNIPLLIFIDIQQEYIIDYKITKMVIFRYTVIIYLSQLHNDYWNVELDELFNITPHNCLELNMFVCFSICFLICY